MALGTGRGTGSLAIRLTLDEHGNIQEPTCPEPSVKEPDSNGALEVEQQVQDHSTFTFKSHKHLN